MISKGAMPDFLIEEMMDRQMIKYADRGSINPASLDLRTTDEILRVENLVLPHKGEKVSQILSFDYVRARRHSISSPLEVGGAYCIRLNEMLDFRESALYGYANPKSTTGRNDVHVRLLANGISRYDTVDAGYNGDLWVLVIPKSFPVIYQEGEELIQLRLFNADTRLRGKELIDFIETENPLGRDGVLPMGDIARDFDGSILLTLDLSQEVLGWECAGCNKVADFSQGKKSLGPQGFFRRIEKNGEHVHLRRGCFYILSTYENVCVPPDYACEMRPMDERAGDFRSHYAGFIDPGWGFGKEGERLGRQLTLEVRPFEDLVIRHRQPIAKIRFERMAHLPKIHYDEKVGSNYKKQDGPTLSKFFKV